jgi:CarboxypepD_reg-like domain
MKPHFTLTIPKPCHENWKDFKPTKQGGFCGSCQKEVIDFTQLSDASIIQFFEKAHINTCGRFRENQLRSFQIDLRSQMQGPMLAILAIATFGLSQPIEAKSPKLKAPVERLDTLAKHHVLTDTLIEKIIITGTVRDQDSVLMPGVNILQKGTTNGAVTDGDGKFMLVIKRPAYVEILQLSFIGMFTIEQEVMATQAEKSIDVIMKPDWNVLNEEIIMGGVCSVRRFTPRWIWWKVRGIFSR